MIISRCIQTYEGARRKEHKAPLFITAATFQDVVKSEEF
jgi:hypothetical protein